ncbi:MAG: RpiB [Actinobacteria bacterium]|nr:RpiB [Actinomycetota bacterium]MBM2828287.1 RpiB [Actinomycetota bacterium]
MKADLLSRLSGMGFATRDLGTDSADPVDYPDYGFAAAALVRRGEADRAILICRSGIGMAICANKSKGVRAAVVATVADAVLSRRHNDANVLVLGADEISFVLARRIAGKWLTTPFDGGRHRRRVDKIRLFEEAHWRERA